MNDMQDSDYNDHEPGDVNGNIDPAFARKQKQQERNQMRRDARPQQRRPRTPKQDAGQTAGADAAPARPVASGGDHLERVDHVLGRPRARKCAAQPRQGVGTGDPAAPGAPLSAEVLLVRYESVARRTDELVLAGLDLDSSQPLPVAPWFPPDTRRSARRVLVHIVAETAQHAGHADIIRETIDGQKTMG